MTYYVKSIIYVISGKKVKTYIFDNVIYRGYSNFMLNMAFISPSEVENIFITCFTKNSNNLLSYPGRYGS